MKRENTKKKKNVLFITQTTFVKAKFSNQQCAFCALCSTRNTRNQRAKKYSYHGSTLDACVLWFHRESYRSVRLHLSLGWAKSGHPHVGHCRWDFCTKRNTLPHWSFWALCISASFSVLSVNTVCTFCVKQRDHCFHPHFFCWLHMSNCSSRSDKFSRWGVLLLTPLIFQT